MVEIMTTETELKLEFDLHQQKQLIDTLQELGVELMPKAQLLARYFDTPDLLLREKKLGLRVRKERDQWIQTIKSTGVVKGAVHLRHERNVQVESQDLDLTKLPVKGRLGKIFDPASVRTQLKPIITTNVQRQIGRWSPNDETIVEVAIDVGDVTAKDQSRPIHEVELELLRGQPAALYQLAVQLSQSVKLTIQTLNKAELGFSLLLPIQAEPVFADLPTLNTSMSAEDGFVRIMEGCLSHFHANYLGVLRGDQEAVHQMRVGLRRMKSCIQVYKKLIPIELTEHIRDTTSWLNEELGPIRDWDVFLSSLTAVQNHFPHRKGLKRVVTLGAGLRSIHHVQLDERLQSQRYHQWVLQLGDWIYNRRWNEDLRRKQRMRVLQPIEDYADQVLKQANKKLVIAGDNFDSLPSDAKHALRIRVKQFRYALQFFRDLYGKKTVQKLSQFLGELQDDLGQLNDLNATGKLLNEIGMSQTNPVRALLEGWYGARQIQQLDHANSSWRQVVRAPLPW